VFRKRAEVYLLFFLAVLLFLGSKDFRYQKANFLGNTVFYPFVGVIRHFQNIKDTTADNQIMRNMLFKNIDRIRRLELGLQRFNNVIPLYELKNENFIIADIVGFSGSFAEKTIIINKGKLKGVTKDIPVVSNKGIFGKIISSSVNTSVVLPIDHPHFKTAVMDKRSRVQGMLEADNDGDLFMSMIEQGADINVKDTLITSNLSTLFPQGFPVGIIEKVFIEPDNFYVKAKIKPFTNTNSLEQVMVLFPDINMNKEIDSSEIQSEAEINDHIE